MGFAVITEKYPGGNSKTTRSEGPLTPELKEYAQGLDAFLAERVPVIEKDLIEAKLLDEVIPPGGALKTRGNVELWHALGCRLREICDERDIRSARQRRWLWEAIDKIHATERIRRARRGRTRDHFEYCYRLSQFPSGFARTINWSEWVYFFDSRTVREERRVDDWLQTLVQQREKIDRRTFRRFTERLNARLQKLDTSVLDDSELSAIYEESWNQTKHELSETPAQGPDQSGSHALTRKKKARKS
jgi:hypothetical protein